MRGFKAFVKKELIEFTRNYKWIILLSTFLFIGMSSPLLAKLLPNIFSILEMGGLTITLPEPTGMDAYSQFFKNMSQMGIIVLLLVYSGILSNELTKGTLTILLSKGLSRNAVILAKYTVALFHWSLFFLIGTIINHVYTIYLFEKTSFDHLFFSLFSLWLFGAFVLALILFSGTVTTGNYGGLLLTVVLLVIGLIANSFSALQKYNPVSLATDNLEILTGEVLVSERIGTVGLTVLLTTTILVFALYFFKEKKV
ncbi:ABC transporter permease [Fervidibacillus halotolerans]|uniref:ABC transporter permease n=1 Tax=Fervidibacillus halotolerans TaxID=2980027 RepID=A0A9E8M019_9BACI|nr:hypothetical protein [Fervidibacillus halotolerans]WAA12880.1 hypothetical protein OE105_01665 [Fervidibacillus halotolerans]